MTTTTMAAACSIFAVSKEEKRKSTTSSFSHLRADEHGREPVLRNVRHARLALERSGVELGHGNRKGLGGEECTRTFSSSPSEKEEQWSKTTSINIFSLFPSSKEKKENTGRVLLRFAARQRNFATAGEFFPIFKAVEGSREPQCPKKSLSLSWSGPRGAWASR